MMPTEALDPRDPHMHPLVRETLDAVWDAAIQAAAERIAEVGYDAGLVLDLKRGPRQASGRPVVVYTRVQAPART